MAKTIKGSAIYGDDGSYIFTPYAEGQPENVSWLPLSTVKYGKLECSKKKVRMVLTMERTDLPLVHTSFITAFAQLARAFNDNKVLKMYKAAANMKPCEVKKEKKTKPKQEVTLTMEVENTESEEEV